MTRQATQHDLQIVMNLADPYSLEYIAQILQVTADLKSGHVLGTGNVLRTDQGTYLLTAAHVPLKQMDGPLAYAIGNGVFPEVITQPWHCIGEPSDLALVRIDPLPVALRRCVTYDMLDTASSTDASVDFHHIHGYPAARSRFSAFGPGVFSQTLPYTTVNASLPAGFNPRIHMAIEYPNEDQRRADGKMEGLPDPGGLSGAIIWNTHYCANSASWSPNQLSIAAIAIRWSQVDGLIIGTRVEVVAECVRIAARG